MNGSGAMAQASVRLARAEDRAALAAVADAHGGARAMATLDLVTLPPGDDCFCLVAERGGVIGWLAAGGCRGQDHKGWGEIYAVVGDGTAPLIAEAVARLRAAEFAGVIADGSIPPDVLIASGFVRADSRPVERAPAGPPAAPRARGARAVLRFTTRGIRRDA